MSAQALWKLHPCVAGQEKPGPRQKWEKGNTRPSVCVAFPPLTPRLTARVTLPADQDSTMLLCPVSPAPNTRPFSLSIPCPMAHDLSVAVQLWLIL